MSKPGKKDDMGGFERYGIGMKILLKNMNYELGGGLGKDGQGIVSPIEAQSRPKNIGLGFNHHHHHQHQHQTIPPSISEFQLAAESVEIRPTDPPIEIQRNKKRKKMKNYVTMPEPKTITKVLDMRGPEVRVLSSLENLNPERPLSELRYNLELLEDFAGIDKEKLNHELRNENETVVVLHKSKKNLRNDLSRLKQQIDSMERLSMILEEMKIKGQSVEEAMTTLDNLAKSFVDIRNLYTSEEEYKLGNLLHIAHSYVVPLFIRVFDRWDPLENRQHGQELVSMWKTLLNFGDHDIYVQLLMEVVFRAVRNCGWEAREPELMIRFLESWRKLLPCIVLENILDSVVVPKISFTVESWNPRTETIPIHLWIHPWLPWLGSHKLEPLYCTIRNRLGSVLDDWHPSDESAYCVLSPWKSVFDADSWERMIVRHILPKLLNVMHGFEIKQENQKPDQFFWVMKWADVLPVSHMVSLMNIFFNKWLDVLYNWLCANPDFEEVAKWYSGWKDVLPDDEHIRDRFNLGLVMMNQAVEGVEITKPRRLKESDISYFRVNEQQRHFERAAVQAQAQAQAEDVQTMSLKDVIEVYAQENEVVFTPKSGRKTQEGHQIYSFGKIRIVIDVRNQKVFAKSDGNWSLVSLQELLELHIRASISQ